MKQLFGRFVSKDIYAQLVDNPELARLGGQRRDMTVLFSDIRGFTTISEHFRTWRAAREQNRDVPPPKGVPEVVANVASELWSEAQELANEALSHYREEANRQVESAQQEAAEARQQECVESHGRPQTVIEGRRQRQ